MDDAPLPATESPTAAAPSAASEASTPPAPEAVSSSAPPAVSDSAAPAAAEPAPAVTPEAPTSHSAAPSTAAAPGEPGKEPTSLLGDAAAPAPEPKADATKPLTEAKPGDKPAAAEGDKAAEAKPDGEAPAEEAPPAEAPLPTYDVFTVPEGVELEDPQVDRFVGNLGQFERRINPTGDPTIHAAVQEFAQQALDQYTEEIAGLADRVARANADTFGRTMESWKNDFFNDPQIGGNRKETTLRNVGAVIGRFGGTPQQIAELRSVYSTTGAGNHRLVLNLFNNIAEFLGEGGAVPGDKPEPQATSRSERRYGKGNR